MRLLTAWLIVVCWSEALALVAWWFGYWGLAGVFLLYPVTISLSMKERVVVRSSRGQEE